MIAPSPTDAHVALVLLAAGAGTRMRSRLPKPLHQVAGLSMFAHVLRAAEGARPVSRCVVLNPASAADPGWQTSEFGFEIAIQREPLGTADALAAALPACAAAKWLLVLFADHPLLTAATVHWLLAKAVETGALVTMLTCNLPDAGAYGRLVRDERGRPLRVVERKDDDPAARTGNAEINSGMLVVDAAFAREALPAIAPSPVTGEFYLPELIRLAVERAGDRASWPVATVAGDWNEVRGVNDRVELAEADAVLRRRIREQHMMAGVTMVQPETITIDIDVEIGPDTTLLPFTVIRRGTTIGRECEIGPAAYLERARLGDRVIVRASTVIDARMATGSDVGPYSHLRGNSRIGAGAHIGNFVELKNTEFGPESRAGHFSYLGDATIGARTNIGAGTVTCNFDGVDKHRTTIGDDAFIGSDTMLVAPVTVGDGGKTGAGAVVTKDVSPGTTVVGVPARLHPRDKGDNG